MASTSWTRSRGLPFFHAFLHLSFALGITLSASSQELALPRPVLLYNDDPSVDTKPIEDVVLRELERRLSEDQIEYLVLDDGFSTEDTPAETILVSEFGIAEDRLYLFLTLRSFDTGATLGGAAGRFTVDIGLFNQVARLYEEINPRVALQSSPAGDETAAAEPAEEGPSLVSAVRFVSPQDGVEVRRGGDGQLLGITDGGEVVTDYLVLGAGEELPLLLERRGFYPKEITVKLGPTREDPIVLPALDRATRVATYLGWSPQQVLGLSLGARYYLQPDVSFLQLEALYHLQRDFNAESTGSSSHFDTRLAGGRYLLLGYSSWFRVSLEAAVGVIYTSFPAKELEAYIDPYVTPVALSLEANGSNVSVFARFETRFALSGAKAFFPPGVIEVPGQDLPIISTLGVLSKW
ncbi:MAG: hypothetical protein ACOCW6_03155 [Spirochaetota bacterium]